MTTISDISKTVHERLEFIEFLLRFRGWLKRADLINRFGISEAASTRDIKMYRTFAEGNIQLNHENKLYEIVISTFKPLFVFSMDKIFSFLQSDHVDKALGLSNHHGLLSPPRLSTPKPAIFETLIRSILSRKSIQAAYTSIEHGQSSKNLIPHAIFDNGKHWYLRAYDKEKKEFRSFKFTRFINVVINENDVVSDTFKYQDHDWNRMVTLELTPHPNRNNVKNPKTIEIDFEMQNGVKTVVLRAAVAGFWLAHWNVDCTQDQSLEGFQYQLWLRNWQSLYDVSSRHLAPGLSVKNNDSIKP